MTFTPKPRLNYGIAAEARASQAEKERDAIREAVFNLIADAQRWEEDVDGDADEYGRPVTYINYHATFSHSSLEGLTDALGIKRAWDETAGDALARAIETAP